MVLVATKIADEILDIQAGSQNALPSVSAFDPLGSPDLLWEQFQNETWPAFVSVGEYIDPSFSGWYYAISDTGFLQFTDTVNIGSIIGTGFSGLFNQGNAVGGGFMSYTGTSGVDFVVRGALLSQSINVDDGVVAGNLNILGTDAIGIDLGPLVFDNVLVPTVTSLPGPELFVGVFGLTDTVGGVGSTYIVVPDGGGGLEVKQVYEANEFTFLRTTLYVGGRYKTMSFLSGVWGLLDWLPTTLGNPFDAVFDTVSFDDAQINADLAANGMSWFTDGAFIYGMQSFNDLGNPIQPYLVKVNSDWTEYTLIQTTTSDANVQSILDDFFLGSTEVYFSYSPSDNALFFTGGVEPVFYGVGFLSTPTPVPFEVGAPPYIPTQALSCQNYCIPLYRTKRS